MKLILGGLAAIILGALAGGAATILLGIGDPTPTVDPRLDQCRMAVDYGHQVASDYHSWANELEAAAKAGRPVDAAKVADLQASISLWEPMASDVQVICMATRPVAEALVDDEVK